MRTPIELREGSCVYRGASKKETSRPLKILLAHHALELAMLAEKIRARGSGEISRSKTQSV